MEVGLGEHGDAEAVFFQNARNDGRAEGRVIDVGVARHEQKIIIVPAPLQHILPGNGEKIASLRMHSLSSCKKGGRNAPFFRYFFT